MIPRITTRGGVPEVLVGGEGKPVEYTRNSDGWDPMGEGGR